MSVRFLSGINVDSNTLFVDDANNRVGIGTASPTQALDVTGRAYISSGASIGTTSTAGTGLTVNGSTVLLSFVEIQQGNLLYLYSSGNTYYSQIYQSGQNLILSPYSNVGIGTTSPAVKFVVSNAGASGFEVDPTGGVGGGPVLQAYNRSTSAYMAQSYYALSHTFNVGSGGSTRAVDITSAGDVAINTTDNALAKLRVVGNGAAGNSAIMADYGNTSVLGEVSMISYRNSAWHTLYVKETGSSATNAVLVEGTKPVIFNAGDVGIGTTSPASKLDVYGIISLNGYNVLQEFGSNNVYANVRVIRNTSSVYGDGMYVNYNSVGTTSAHLRFFANGTSERMRIDASTGNVGIGTTSPAQKLDVSGNIQATTGLILTGNAAKVSTTYSGVTVTNFFTDANGGVISVDGSNRISLRQGGVSGTDAITIAGSGNVGIGTTAPDQKLHVKRTETVNRTSYTDILTIDADANNSPFSGHGGGILFRGTTYSGGGNNIQGNRIWGRIGMFLNDFYDGFNGESMLFAVAPDDRSDTLTTAMIIQYDGKVGIGTTSPGELLEVVGNIRANVSNGGGFMLTGASASGLVRAGATGLALRTDTTDRLTIDNSGAATFSSSVTASSLIKSGGTSSQYLMADGSVSTLTNPVTGTGTTNYVPKWTSGSAIGNSQIFDNGTNVGIGTASPSYKLDVNGEINARSNSQVSGKSNYFQYKSNLCRR